MFQRSYAELPEARRHQEGRRDGQTGRGRDGVPCVLVCLRSRHQSMGDPLVLSCFWMELQKN